MAAAVHIPVEEYLRSSYQPDCDYVDGELQERNVGTQSHSILQYLLAKWFDDRFDALGWVGSPEQRIQVAAHRFRVPDVCALVEGAGEELITTPPLVCVEILSPEDTLTALQDRLDDYLAIGVLNVWVFDPVRYLAWSVSSEGAIRPVRKQTLEVRGTGEALDLPILFSALERRLHRLRP